MSPGAAAGAVARYAKAVAKPGQGEALAAKLLEVADVLRAAPGCLLYIVNLQTGEPDVVWVTELWRSQEQLEASLDSDAARVKIPEILELVQDGGFERVDLEPLGGVGHRPPETGFAIVNLDEVDDMAARAGFGEMGEARFARDPLGAVGIGLSLQRLRPGKRQAFGHHHHVDEEVYVVLKGSGRAAIDDELRDIGPLDAIRVAPGSTRAFEAGPEGLELLAMGSHRPGDAEMVPGWWAPES